MSAPYGKLPALAPAPPQPPRRTPGVERVGQPTYNVRVVGEPGPTLVTILSRIDVRDVEKWAREECGLPPVHRSRWRRLLTFRTKQPRRNDG